MSSSLVLNRSVSAASDGSSEAIDIDDWIDLPRGGDELSQALFDRLFPTKPKEKVARWLKTLRDNEFDTLRELSDLDESGWTQLQLPLAVVTRLKAAAVALRKQAAESESKTELLSTSNSSSFPPPPPLISQVDCVVMDISSSMRATSALDVDKTREDVSKMLFHTLMDKLISLELSHAVGLLAFGEKLTPIPITREYERFHDELGRLDAREGRTMLYDAIFSAAETLDAYCAANSSQIEPDCVKRIFVLTDGEDNASRYAPWQVAQFLQQKKIVLDAIPLAGGSQKVLRSMCAATSGLFCQTQTQEQAIRLFEREATLHVQYREAPAEHPPVVSDMSVLRSLEGSDEAAPAVVDVQSAVPKAVFAPALSAADAAQAAASIESSSSSSAAMRRVMKEYREFTNNPVPGWSVFVSADNAMKWKAFLTDAGSPYEGGTWLLTIDFPSDYPFKPPRVRFVTPIYHCNISNDGNLCLDILKNMWNPALTVLKVMLAISSLLADPNAMDPLDAFKGQLYKDNRALYLAEAERWTREKAGQSMSTLATLYNVEL
jgi:ubiquitin-protein ligase